MNSSSSKRLCQELESLKKDHPRYKVGAAWIICGRNQTPTGWRLLEQSNLELLTLRGRQAYDYVSGHEGEMDKVFARLQLELRAERSMGTLNAKKFQTVSRRVRDQLLKMFGSTSDDEVIQAMMQASVS